MGRRCLILSGKWQFKDTGRTTLGNPQSREHIRLVAQAGFSMMTFPMKWSNSRQDEDGNGPPVIDDFPLVPSTRGLLQTGNDWYETDLTQDEGEIGLAEEREAPERYPEAGDTAVSFSGGGYTSLKGEVASPNDFSWTPILSSIER